MRSGLLQRRCRGYNVYRMHGRVLQRVDGQHRLHCMPRRGVQRGGIGVVQRVRSGDVQQRGWLGELHTMLSGDIQHGEIQLVWQLLRWHVQL